MSNKNEFDSILTNSAKIWFMYCDGTLYHN